MLSKQRVLCLVSRVRRRSFGPNARQEMSKFVLLAAAFALGTSLALTGKTAPVDTLKSARWTPTLPDFYSREKYASAAEARAEARAAIPWFESWEEGADVLDASKLSDEEIPCCSEMKYCGASLADEEEALVNVAVAMGFNYAYEGFPTC